MGKGEMRERKNQERINVENVRETQERRDACENFGNFFDFDAKLYVVFFAFSETKVFAFDSLEGMKVRDDAGLEGCTTERIKGMMDAGSF